MGIVFPLKARYDHVSLTLEGLDKTTCRKNVMEDVQGAEGGPPPAVDTPEGQREQRQFQEAVFVDVFEVRDPEFTEFDPKNLTPTVVAVQRFRPRQRERTPSLF